MTVQRATTFPLSIWLNSSEIALNKIPGYMNAAGTANMRIGARSSSMYMDGYIAEIVGYTRILSETERKRVEAYLNAKYKLY